MRRRSAVLFATVAVCLAVAAQADCPDVDVRPEDEHRYTERRAGDRVWCEGRFAESTSGGMTAVGFGAGAAVERQDDGRLAVHWPPVDRPTSLRIRSRRSRAYYLLDAEAPPREARFVWPAQVIDQIKIPESDLVVALRAERDGRDALVPVGRVGEPLRVAFLSAVAFENVTAELFRVEAGGEQPVPWEDQRELGAVPANQLFRIALPERLGPGLYRVKVIGETTTRPVPTIEYLWIP